MSLRAKFVLLIGMLAIAVAGSIGAARWSFVMLHRQLATPLASASFALDALANIKRNAESQAAILGGGSPGDPIKAFQQSSADAPRGVRGGLADTRPPPPSPEQAAKYKIDAGRIRERIASLEDGELYRTVVGSATWQSLRAMIRRADTLAVQWFDQKAADGPTDVDSEGGEPAGDEHDPLNLARIAAIGTLFQVHELIEQTELRIHRDTGTASRNGDVIQAQLQWWLGSVFLVAILVSVLSVALLGRWVSRPVSLLRDAAARIAQGDFSHRVPVEGTDELGLLTAEVNHMAEMVSQLQDERVERERLAAVGSMVRRLVHSLRNPLSGIRGLAEVTRLDLAPNSDNRANLDHIVTTVETFERWLNELLNTTSPGALAIAEHEIRPWLEGIVDAHRPMAQVRGITLRVDAGDVPDIANFDSTHLGHAVAAIVSNAVEASPPDSEVRIAALRSKDPAAWEIRVSDQGPGVPEPHRARIFEPSFTTKPHGHGIGLAVAQQAALAHGGRILVEQPAVGGESHGSTFVVRIPLAGCRGQPPVTG